MAYATKQGHLIEVCVLVCCAMWNNDDADVVGGGGSVVGFSMKVDETISRLRGEKSGVLRLSLTGTPLLILHAHSHLFLEALRALILLCVVLCLCWTTVLEYLVPWFTEV